MCPVVVSNRDLNKALQPLPLISTLLAPAVFPCFVAFEKLARVKQFQTGAEGFEIKTLHRHAIRTQHLEPGALAIGQVFVSKRFAQHSPFAMSPESLYGYQQRECGKPAVLVRQHHQAGERESGEEVNRIAEIAIQARSDQGARLWPHREGTPQLESSQCPQSHKEGGEARFDPQQMVMRRMEPVISKENKTEAGREDVQRMAQTHVPILTEGCSLRDPA